MKDENSINNENKEKDNNFGSRLFIYFIYLCFVGFLFGMERITVSFDNGPCKAINIICYVFLIALGFMYIVEDIKEKKINNSILVIGIIVFVVLAINNTYYNYFSIKLESTNYLTKKYKWNKNNMEVIDTQDYKSYLFSSPTPRGALIKYDGEIIYVYYDKGWKDNYEELKNYYQLTNDYNEEFEKIFNEYRIDYKIVLPSINSDKLLNNNDSNQYKTYVYTFYVNSSDSKTIEEIINRIKEVDYKLDSFEYNFYFIKDKDLFNRMDKNSYFITNYKAIESADEFDKDLFEKEIEDDNYNIIYQYHIEKLINITDYNTYFVVLEIK